MEETLLFEGLVTSAAVDLAEKISEQKLTLLIVSLIDARFVVNVEQDRLHHAYCFDDGSVNEMEIFDPVFVVANFLKEVCLVGFVLFSLRVNESIRYMSVDRGMEAAHEIVKQSFVCARFCLVEYQVQHLLISAATVEYPLELAEGFV